MNACPECGEPVDVWADRSGGVTVNYRCANLRCKSGKGPWDSDPDVPAEAPVALVERRGDRWVVLYAGAIVGRHTARYRATEQADRLNDQG